MHWDHEDKTIVQETDLFLVITPQHVNTTPSTRLHQEYHVLHVNTTNKQPENHKVKVSTYCIVKIRTKFILQAHTAPQGVGLYSP